MKSSDLNGISDISDVGDVDMFGLDAFGNPVGLGAAWGALIGGGLATATSIGLRAFSASPTVYKWSEGIGFGVGALAGGVMMFFESMRHSGLAAIATALATNGLRQVEMLFGPSAALAAYTSDPVVAGQIKALVAKNPPAPVAPVAGKVGNTTTVDNGDGTFTITTTDAAGAVLSTVKQDKTGKALGGLYGATRFSPTGVVRGLGNGRGLGVATLEPTGVVMGAGNDGLPQLVGSSSKTQKVNSATLLGVPGLNSPFSGISGHFGSSIIG